MNAKSAATPNYVLMEGANRIGPEMLVPGSGLSCVAIYGFSDKQPYDAFCANSKLALTPYPLVKGYLKNRLELADDALLLVVIDAESPDQSVLDGATMQAVLDALMQDSPVVAVSYRLTKDEHSNAYQVDECDSVVPLRIYK